MNQEFFDDAVLGILGDNQESLHVAANLRLASTIAEAGAHRAGRRHRC